MKTNLQKLTSLLCEVEEVKKNITYLDLLKYLKNKWKNFAHQYNIWINYWTEYLSLFEVVYSFGWEVNVNWIKYNKLTHLLNIADKPFNFDSAFVELYQQNEETLWKIFNFLIDRKNES